MTTKAEVRKIFNSALRPHGFVQKGNYFDREERSVRQSLYLYPARGGGSYLPEMLITFATLNPERANRDGDCHLSARLSSFYNPKGDPETNREWEVRFGSNAEDKTLQEGQIVEAVAEFLHWLDEYPSCEVACEKMQSALYANPVDRFRMFDDLGRPVPVPVGNLVGTKKNSAKWEPAW